MGWQHEEHPDHEGYVVGFVMREGCSVDSGIYRELAYPTDDLSCEVERLAAGCDCGWRSSRWIPSRTAANKATWSPFSVMVSDVDEERASERWRRHLVLDVDDERRTSRRG